MLNWIVRNRTVWFFNCIYQQNVFTNRIFDKYVKTGYAKKKKTIKTNATTSNKLETVNSKAIPNPQKQIHCVILESIRWAQHLIVECGSSASLFRQNNSELPNYASLKYCRSFDSSLYKKRFKENLVPIIILVSLFLKKNFYKKSSFRCLSKTLCSVFLLTSVLLFVTQNTH